jgi:hypothetical protein
MRLSHSRAGERLGMNCIQVGSAELIEDILGGGPLTGATGPALADMLAQVRPAGLNPLRHGASAYLDSTTRRQPPRSEFRRPKPERRPNTEGRSRAWAFRVSGVGLLSALGFRASGLGLCAHGLVVRYRYARGDSGIPNPLARLIDLG